MAAPATTTPDRALHRRVRAVLAAGVAPPDALRSAAPLDERDRLLALLSLHDLHLAPLDRAGPAVRWQHHPVLAELKQRLEADVLAALERDAGEPIGAEAEAGGAVAAMRAVAAHGQVPPVYEWLAEEATWPELVEFLALEGGPDANFDDLVAACQIGLAGRPKLEMARNYWDEMGRGNGDDVHTELHHRLVAAIDMPTVPPDEQPVQGLLRSVLGGMLATNRWLQPELVGALGLTELQAGPRCRKVVAALKRLGASQDALGFYEEHAVADPRHGKGWLDEVVTPMADDPDWAPRIVRGARWRAAVNDRFFAELGRRFVGGEIEHRKAS
jgi:hypothetical protein